MAKTLAVKGSPVRLILSLLLASLGLMPLAAKAEGPVVLELFTSQGCSACPPADALLGELAMREDVIALSLHVDYWDYIGWADTFASRQFTERQYGYGHAAGSTVVFTPQMVIGGQDTVVGYRPMGVADLLAAHQAQTYPVAIRVEDRGGAYLVEAVAEMPAPHPMMVVQLVTFSPREEVEIGRGENAGRHAVYHNVVTAWDVVDEWDGAAPYQAEVAAAGGEGGMAVIIQTQGFGPILGAARLN